MCSSYILENIDNVINYFSFFQELYIYYYRYINEGDYFFDIVLLIVLKVFKINELSMLRNVILVFKFKDSLFII